MDKLMNPFRWLAYIFYIFARKYHLKSSRSVYFFAIQESIMLLILSSMEIIMLLFNQIRKSPVSRAALRATGKETEDTAPTPVPGPGAS